MHDPGNIGGCTGWTDTGRFGLSIMILVDVDSWSTCRQSTAVGSGMNPSMCRTICVWRSGSGRLTTMRSTHNRWVHTHTHTHTIPFSFRDYVLRIVYYASYC